MRGTLLTASGFLLSLLVGWATLPGLFYHTEQPPFRFSHKVHTGGANQMACQDCHSLQENGRFDGLPVLATCANCHAAPMGTTKEEAAFINEYVTPGREPQWGGRSRQPDNAWFPHAAHVKRAKLTCETCHPGTGQSDAMPVVRVNRISGYSEQVMTRARMSDCVDCHRKHNLSHSCADCHK